MGAAVAVDTLRSRPSRLPTTLSRGRVAQTWRMADRNSAFGDLLIAEVLGSSGVDVGKILVDRRFFSSIASPQMLGPSCDRRSGCVGDPQPGGWRYHAVIMIAVATTPAPSPLHINNNAGGRAALDGCAPNDSLCTFGGNV